MASYVPLRLSGGEDILTSQPAVTVQTMCDVAFEDTLLQKEQEDSSAVTAQRSRHPDQASSDGKTNRRVPAERLPKGCSLQQLYKRIK